MAVFLSDTFTDTDAVELSAHSPDIGGTWTKRAGPSELEILSNALVMGGTEFWCYYTNAATPGNNQYDVSVDITKGVGNLRALGPIARYVDFSNFYHGRYANDTQAYRIRKKVSGIYTELVSFSEALPAGTDTLKFEIRNVAKKLYYGGVEKCSTADDTLTADGIVGLQWQLWIGDNDWVMDNLSCDVSGAISGAAVLSGVGSLSAVGARTVVGSAVLSGVGSLTAVGTKGVTQEGAVVLDGVGGLTAVAVIVHGGLASMAGVGELTAVGERIVTGAASLDGVGDLTAIGEVAGLLEGRAVLAGVGSLTAVAERIVAGQVAMAGVGSLTAKGVLVAAGVASLSGVGELTAIGETGVIVYTQMGRRTFDIDPADYPAGTLFYFEANMETEGTGQEAYVRLYNITDASEVSGSPIVIPGPGPAWGRSGSFALPSGVKRYRVEYGGTTGGIITPHGAALRVVSS